MRESFQMLDRDDDGTIGPLDVQDMLSQLGSLLVLSRLVAV